MQLMAFSCYILAGSFHVTWYDSTIYSCWVNSHQFQSNESSLLNNLKKLSDKLTKRLMTNWICHCGLSNLNPFLSFLGVIHAIIGLSCWIYRVYWNGNVSITFCSVNGISKFCFQILDKNLVITNFNCIIYRNSDGAYVEFTVLRDHFIASNFFQTVHKKTLKWSNLLDVQVNVFICPVFSDQQCKIQRYSVYHNSYTKIQWKAGPRNY